MMLMRCNDHEGPGCDDEEATHVQEVKHVRYEPKGPHVDDKSDEMMLNDDDMVCYELNTWCFS